jgi:hypothetical protein
VWANSQKLQQHEVRQNFAASSEDALSHAFGLRLCVVDQPRLICTLFVFEFGTPLWSRRTLAKSFMVLTNRR